MLFYTALAATVLLGLFGIRMAHRYFVVLTALYAVTFVGCLAACIVVGYNEPIKDNLLLLQVITVSGSYFLALFATVLD